MSKFVGGAVVFLGFLFMIYAIKNQPSGDLEYMIGYYAPSVTVLVAGLILSSLKGATRNQRIVLLSANGWVILWTIAYISDAILMPYGFRMDGWIGFAFGGVIFWWAVYYFYQFIRFTFSHLVKYVKSGE